MRDIVVDQGFTEVYNYSFLSEEAVRAFGFDPAAHVRVANPIASDQALMRTSLLPGIWKNIPENAKHRESFRLFEIGLEIHTRPAEALPDEIPHLVAAIYDRQGDGAAGLFELKRVAECLMPGAEACPAEAARLRASGARGQTGVAGRAGGPPVRIASDAGGIGPRGDPRSGPAVLESLSAGEVRYTPIRRYPSSAFDLSVIAATREQAGKIAAGSRRSPDRCSNPSSSCASIPGRRSPRAGRAFRSA